MTDPSGEDKRLEHLDKAVAADYATEWLRKGALETRALAMVTANLAFVTLFLALRAQLELTDELSSCPSSQLLVAGLCAAGLSLLAGAVAAAPAGYPRTQAAGYEALRKDVAVRPDAGAQELQDEIVQAKIEQLRLAVASNQRKGWIAVVAFWLFTVAVLLLVAALIAALV